MLFMAAAIGATASTIGGIISSAMQVDANEKMQKNAQEFAVMMANNQYGILRNSLERAGFNPLLAIGNAQPNVPTGGGAGAGAGLPNLGNIVDIEAGVSAAREAAIARDRADTVRADADTAKSIADQERHHRITAEYQASQSIWDNASAKERWDQMKTETLLKRSQLPRAAWINSIYKGKQGRALTTAQEWAGPASAVGKIVGDYLRRPRPITPRSGRGRR